MTSNYRNEVDAPVKEYGYSVVITNSQPNLPPNKGWG